MCTKQKCLVHSARVDSSVGGDGAVDPALELGHSGVHSRPVNVTRGATKGNDSHQGPLPTNLTHQRTTGVTLEKTHSHNS